MNIMPDFSMLSLSEIDMLESPKLPQFLEIEDTGYNNILDSETIEELLINIHSYEDPAITFEELQHKLIEFYFQEANDELLFSHLTDIYNSDNHSIIVDIYDRLMYTFNDNDNDNNNFNLNAIIEFISSPNGTEYLRDIFNMNCVIV